MFGSKSNPSDINYFSAELGFPLKLKEDLLILNPFIERYDLVLEAGSTHSQTLNSVGFPFTYLKQCKSVAWKIAYVFIPRINADLKHVVADDYQFGGAVVAIYKKKENLSYKFGMYYNSEFFGPFFVPLLGLDWNIREDLNLFGLLPGNLALEYKFNSAFFGGINFKSITNSYRFDGLAYVKVADNYLKLFLDYYLAEKIVITIESGITAFRKYKTGHTNELFTQNNFDDGLLLKAGLSYRIRLDKKN